MFTIRLQTRRPQWRNAVALSWAPAGETPKKVTLSRDGDLWSFSVAGRTVSLDLPAQTATTDSP
jgi:hypothetical protein